jgi:DUF4097 and DUF4098 domain-containing protein YvlB
MSDNSKMLAPRQTDLTVGGETMESKQERDKILQMLHEGQISLEEAEALLDALEQTTKEGSGRGRTDSGDRTRKASSDDWGFDFGAIGREIEEAVRSAVQGVKEALPEEGQFGDWLHGVFGSAKAVENRAFTVPAEGLDKLVVRTTRGTTRLRGADTSTISVRAQVTAWAMDEEAAERAKLAVEIQHEITDGVLTVSANTLDRQVSRRFRVDYEIEAPRDLAAELLSKSGKVVAEDRSAFTHLSSLSGSLEGGNLNGGGAFSSKSGSIRLSHAAGELEADSASGSVAMEAVSGHINVRSVSGSIRLTADANLQTDLEARTVSGGLKLDGIHGQINGESKSGTIQVANCQSSQVSLKTISGSVRAEIDLTPRADLSLSTTSGSARLAIPDETSARVSLRTTSGGINCNLPLGESARTRTRVEGVLGAGEGPISVSTVSGSIHIDGLG